MTTAALGTIADRSGPIDVPLDAALPAAPIAVVDILLDAALAADAAFVWIEPAAVASGQYLISIEREGRVVASATLEAQLAAAVIARVAYITGVDLTSPRAVTGSSRIRSCGRERDLVFTLRPGGELRGELTFVTRGPRLTIARDRYDDLKAGDRVDHYRVTAKLGEGGMGSVYRVEHATLGRANALKVLHGNVLSRDPGSIDRFLREARAASRIQHPHIVDVFDFGYLTDGRPYFVMELLGGHSLADRIDRGALPPEQAMVFARQLAEALAAAHDHGVIHADVTPSNILITTTRDQAEIVKLVDFGLAELRERRIDRDETPEYVLGTPCYISPEQIRGQPADERSDQYSLGIVLFEMIAGKPPFNHKNVRELCMKHLRDPVPDLLSPLGALPDELATFIARCLAKSPAQRFPSIRALLAELDEVGKLVDRKGWRRWLA